jgi:hypothetical protein
MRYVRGDTMGGPPSVVREVGSFPAIRPPAGDEVLPDDQAVSTSIIRTSLDRDQALSPATPA